MSSLKRFFDGMDQETMNLDETQRNLLDALRYFVGKIVEQQLNPKVPSRELVSALTGLSFTLLMDHIPNELVAFSKHAGRKVIQDEDMFLFTRKTSLCEHLKEHRVLMGDSPKKTVKKRKSAADNENDDVALDAFAVEDSD